MRTKNVLGQLSKTYSDPSYYGTVTALSLLNEPATYLNDQLLSTTHQFYYDGYGATRWPWLPSSASKSGLLIVIHDGFQPLSYWSNYMSEPNFESVALDTHFYSVSQYCTGARSLTVIRSFRRQRTR